MKRVFYGAAIQGEKDLGARADFHAQFMERIRQSGFEVIVDHTSGKTRESISEKMEERMGDLPPYGTMERRRIVRDILINHIEGDIAAAVFEVSTPSLGTGVELTHAYLRPRLGLKPIPILILYKEGHWPHDLSTMVYGLHGDQWPNIKICRYPTRDDAVKKIQEFLSPLL